MRTFCIVVLTLLLSPPVCACSMGMGLYFKEGLPSDYATVHSQDARLDQVVEQTLGDRYWVYADGGTEINVPAIAENPALVPVHLRLSPADERIPIEKLIVLMEKHIDVMVTKGEGPAIPNRNGQVPINLEFDTIEARSASKVAEYDLGPYTYSELSMRLDLSGASKVRIVVLLVPAANQPVRVIQQDEPTRIHRCDRTIYVDGPMPKGSRRAFYYF